MHLLEQTWNFKGVGNLKKLHEADSIHILPHRPYFSAHLAISLRKNEQEATKNILFSFKDFNRCVREINVLAI